MDTNTSSLTKLQHKDVCISPVKITDKVVGQWFRIDNTEIGKISKVIDDKTIVVNTWDDLAAEFTGSEIFRIEILNSKHHSFNTKFLL